MPGRMSESHVHLGLSLGTTFNILFTWATIYRNEFECSVLTLPGKAGHTFVTKAAGRAIPSTLLHADFLQLVQVSTRYLLCLHLNLPFKLSGPHQKNIRL